jgi:hypothetical protein
MRHSADFTLAHPVMPFAAAPDHLRKRLGLPKRASVTEDGRLAFQCGWKGDRARRANSQ